MKIDTLTKKFDKHLTKIWQTFDKNLTKNQQNLTKIWQKSDKNLTWFFLQCSTSTQTCIGMLK